MSLATNPTLTARAIRLMGIVCACAIAVGCDDGTKPGTARLQGTVTVNGQPPPEGAVGSISFRATAPGQAASTSAQIVDGKYDCPNVPLGNVTVFIQLVQPTGKMISEGGREYPELRNFVSSKYDNGIPLEITGDDSSQDFELAAGGAGS